MSMYRSLVAVAALAACLPITAGEATAHNMGAGSGFSLGHGPFHQAAFHSHRFFDHRHVFFRHRRHRIFLAFDFVAFGFPWWYPDYYDYGYPSDYAYADSGPGPGYQYWNDLAISVQKALTQRGYYHGPIGAEVSSSGREAIRAFQAAHGLPVTGLIDPKLLNALGIPYRSAQA